MQGWPDNRRKVSKEVQPYLIHCVEITAEDRILLKINRIIIPPWLTPSTLSKIHEGHLGIDKSYLKARDAVFWPGMKQGITQLVECCEICQGNVQSQKWPPIQQPEMHPHAWHTLVCNLFYFNKQNYIITVDHFSEYPVVRKMPNITSAALVHVMSEIFVEWGPPHTIKADNGTQYISKEFMEFLSRHKVRLITSSPHYPQSNGLAEVYVNHARNLIIKTLEAGKLWFHGLQEYTNSPQPTFTTWSNDKQEAPYQPSSIASSQWRFHWVLWRPDATTRMSSFTLQVRITNSRVVSGTTCMGPETR